jgi:hypothetical protein
MPTLNEVVADVQRIVRGVEGIRKAPDSPPEKLGVYPYSVCYPRSGDTNLEYGMIKGLHTIWLEIHIARKDMPRDTDRAMEYIKKVYSAIWEEYADSNSQFRDVLGGEGAIDNISYTFGVLNWLGIDTVGVRFFINGVKTQDGV